MRAFRFEKVQDGYRSNTKPGKVVTIQTDSLVRFLIQKRKDFHKRLRNDTHTTWIMLDTPSESC